MSRHSKVFNAATAPAILPFVILSLILLAVCLFLSSPVAAQPGPPLSPPSGQLIDVGGYRLHIDCRGQAHDKASGLSSPAVILESGAGGFSLEWRRIQQALSKEHVACSYDRAGYGWSDAGPLPRTSDRIARELKILLQKRRIPGPYILVGHSFGGYTAQYFAREFPQLTAAIVLIESSHPEQAERLPKPKSEPGRSPQARRAGERAEMRPGRAMLITIPVLHHNYPAEVINTAWPLIASRRHTLTWREEMRSIQISGARLARAAPMPDIPVVVITRGRRVWPRDEHGSEMERIWMQLQDELSALGRHSIHLIAERSGHAVHLDQPEYVLNALGVLLDGR